MAKTSDKIVKTFQGLPQWAKGAVAVGGVLVIGFITYKLFKYLTTDKQMRLEEQQLEQDLDDTKLSYPKTQYNTWANKLETAMFSVGTYEEDIYAIFRMLKNNNDYLQLLKSFGRRKYSGGVLPGIETTLDFSKGWTLNQWLTEELSTSELRKVNDILRSKGIKYRV